MKKEEKKNFLENANKDDNNVVIEKEEINKMKIMKIIKKLIKKRRKNIEEEN